jgi:hypothetical protein
MTTYYLKPVLNLTIGETTAQLVWVNDLSQNYALRLVPLYAALPANRVITLTFQVQEPYMLIGKAAALNLIRYASTDENGEWVSSEVGDNFKTMSNVYSDLFFMKPNKSYSLIFFSQANINTGDLVFDLKGKFLSTLDYFFENEIEDLIQDPKIIITRDDYGIHTFKFENYEFKKDTNLILGYLKNATTYGELIVQSYISHVQSYTDRFSLNGSCLINVNCIEDGFYTGIITVKIDGNGFMQEQGLVTTNIPLIKQPNSI